MTTNVLDKFCRMGDSALVLCETIDLPDRDNVTGGQARQILSNSASLCRKQIQILTDDVPFQQVSTSKKKKNKGPVTVTAYT